MTTGAVADLTAYSIEVDRDDGSARLVCTRCADGRPWDGTVHLDGDPYPSWPDAALTDLIDAAEQHERTVHPPTITLPTGPPTP